jgi:hypothetical protein
MKQEKHRGRVSTSDNNRVDMCLLLFQTAEKPNIQPTAAPVSGKKSPLTGQLHARWKVPILVGVQNSHVSDMFPTLRNKTGNH